jgi:hypothetical protein
MDRRQLTDLYRQVLQEQLGYACVAFPDGDLIVRRADRAYLVSLFADQDPEFVQLMHQLKLDVSDLTPIERLRASQLTTRRTKGAAVLFHDSGTAVVTVELIVAPANHLPETGHLVAILPRALSMLDTAEERFRQEVEIARLERQFGA